MKRVFLSFVFLLTSMSFAAPECLIDATQKDSTSLIAVISGSAKGFDVGPVYITVTNGDKKYTTLVNREGKWALMYPSLVMDTQVLCWQGWTTGKTMDVSAKAP